MSSPKQALEIARKRSKLLNELRKEARHQKVAPLNVQHQFAFDMFLTRLFSHEECPWVLKGGTSLLLRIGSGRRSKDIDLARKNHLKPSEALKELRTFVNTPGPTDPDFTFELKEPARDNQDLQDPTRGSIKVEMKIGELTIVKFSLDLSTQQHLDYPVDQVPISPVIEHECLPPGTIVSMVTVENVVADKLCACYELHRGTEESTRFHDLIDLVRITTSQSLDAEKLSKLVAREKENRPTAVLPTNLESPGPKWEKGYPKQAHSAADFPPVYHELNVALDTVGKCLNDLLSGKGISGTWSPALQRWEQ